MGVGGNAPTSQAPAADHLAQLANRLIELQSRVREKVVEGTVINQGDSDAQAA
jgi:hypothetical protein